MNLPFYFLITPLILILCPFRIEAANEKVEKKILPSQSLETNKFQIKYEGLADSGAAFDILSILDEAYYDIGNDLGYFPEESIEVIIYTSKKHKLPSVMPDWASGLYDGSIHLKIGDIKRGRERLKYIVYQGYTQALLYQWVGKDPILVQSRTCPL